MVGSCVGLGYSRRRGSSLTASACRKEAVGEGGSATAPVEEGGAAAGASEVWRAVGWGRIGCFWWVWKAGSSMPLLSIELVDDREESTEEMESLCTPADGTPARAK